MWLQQAAGTGSTPSLAERDGDAAECIATRSAGRAALSPARRRPMLTDASAFLRVARRCEDTGAPNVEGVDYSRGVGGRSLAPPSARRALMTRSSCSLNLSSSGARSEALQSVKICSNRVVRCCSFQSVPGFHLALRRLAIESRWWIDNEHLWSVFPRLLLATSVFRILVRVPPL